MFDWGGGGGGGRGGDWLCQLWLCIFSMAYLLLQFLVWTDNVMVHVCHDHESRLYGQSQQRAK